MSDEISELDDEQNGKERVGYGRPPKASQFKPGQSGNPKGRPKGLRNLASVLDHAMRERVTVIRNGRRLTICKLEVAMTQLANKGAAGDLNAVRLITQLQQTAEAAQAGAGGPVVAPLLDKDVMTRLFQRARQAAAATPDPDPSSPNHELNTPSPHNDQKTSS